MDFNRERPPLTRETSALPSPPAAFGRYRVVHQVGAGALGPVFRCQDPETDRAVAVKTFTLDITPEQATELAAALAALASLNLSHPSIIAPLAAGAQGSTAFLVQDYFVAESVDVALRQYGPAPIPDALRLIGQLAGAIDFAAVTGVRHGSLHPRDILVAPHEVRLTGLGVAQAVEQVGFRVAPRLPYSAPERVDGHQWSGAADVFGLAAVALELLTGRRPSLGASPLAADAVVSGAADPAALNEAFARALSARPEDRFPTALTFAASLRHALTGEPLELAPVHPQVAKRRERGTGRPGRVPPEPKPDVEAAPAEPAPGPGVVPVPLPGELPAPLEEVPVSAADELLAAPAVDEDLVLQPVQEELQAREPPIDAGSLASPEAELADPRLTDAEAPRFADIEPVADAETLAPPEAPGPQRFAAVEPPGEMFQGADESFASERLPFDASLELRTEPPLVEPHAVGLPAVESPAVERPRVSLPPSEPFRDGERDRRLSRPEEIATAPRDEVTMPPPSRDPVPGRPFTPPPGRRTAPSGRTRLPLSWLLAMLLVGVLGGFVGGYFLGSGDRRGAGPAEQSALPSAGAEPEPATPQATPAPPGGGAAAEERPSEAAAPPRPQAPAKPRELETRKPAARPAPPAAARRPAAPAPSRAARPSAGPPAGEKADRSARFEGSLAVISRPAGATVRLDGRVVGKTPLTLPEVGAGSHALRLELDGYRPWSAAIQVVAGTQNRVTASLEQRPGGIDE